MKWDYVPDDLRVRYDSELISIPNAVRVSAERFGDREAVVDGPDRLSFTELHEAMVACVRSMLALGIGPGDRVAVWAPNSLRWILAALGIQGSGAILVPVNTRFKGEEAAYVLRKSGASALVVVTDFLDNDYLSMLREADPTSPLLADGRIVVASGHVAQGQLSWRDFLLAGTATPRDEAVAAIDSVCPDDLSDIMFTSGTTGHPKGVMLTHGQSLRAHGWLAKVMDFRAGDRYLIIPPFFHTFGYKAGWMACVVHGVTAIPLAVFSVSNVLQMIEREDVSILLGPPTLFQGILDEPRRADYDLSSIRVTMVSAASTPPELVIRIKDELGAEVTHTAYGLTEATSMVTTTFPGIDSFEMITTTVGRAALDIEVRVVDDDGRDVGPGTPGELLCRGYVVMRGYWDDPEQTAQAVTSDGWLRTGDVAVADSEGYIRITDRKKDMLIVGGFNVYPAEIERILGRHSEVEAIAVVGVPDDRLGEVAVAFVVPSPGSALSAEDFLAWAATRVANFKCPRQAILVPDLPRNASMKVLKNELRARVRTG